MKIQIDLAEIPWYYHVICLITILFFAVPESFQLLTKASVSLFALFYRFIGYIKTKPPLKWCVKSPTVESRLHEETFKLKTTAIN